MYASKIRYLATAFVDAESIIAKAHEAAELMKILKDDRLFPMLILEESPAGPIPRIGFQSADGEWQLVMLGKRFDFAQLAKQPQGSDLGDFSSFCREAIPKLTVVLDFYGRKSHRLAAVQEGFLQEMPQPKMDALAKTLFNLPPTFNERLPFEWDWRCVSLIERLVAELKEETNTNTAIKRRSGYIAVSDEEGVKEKPYDRIRVDFDINTSLKNVSARFGEKEIANFFEKAPAWHEELCAEVFSFISGGNAGG